jgi:hypothetical protein
MLKQTSQASASCGGASSFFIQKASDYSALDISP